MTDPEAMKKKILALVREVGLLREELLGEEKDPGSVMLELTYDELATVVYVLALGWLTECVNAKKDYIKMVNRISGVSALIMAADSRKELDKFLEDTLGGEAA